MLAILALSFLPDNVAVLTSCRQEGIKHQYHPLNTETLSQRCHNFGLSAVSTLELKVSPTLVDNLVAASKIDAAATLSQRSANVVTAFQICNFRKCLQRYFNVAPTSLQLTFWYSLESYLYGGNS